MVTGYGEFSVLAAAKPVLVTSPLRVLLVGTREEDFFLIREILERSRKMISAELDHARSIDEAKILLRQQPYGLVLFEHETEDAEALRLIAEFLHAGVSVPFILLTEDADEKTVADAIETGDWNCVSRSQLDGATLVQTMRSTLALHSLRQEQHTTEESLRKLSRAVEQSRLGHRDRSPRNY
jgi:DNA-binding NtrC family response regulator